MKILRLSTLSLTLAIAVITLGYANSSFAGPDCEKHPNHESCAGGGAQTTYTVNWVMGKHNPGGMPTLSPQCTGDAVRGLSVDFDINACKIAIDGVEDYCICGISVRHNKKDTSLIVFVHRPCNQPHCGNDAWQAGRLPATLELKNGGPDLTITADALPAGALLTKVNQPDKGTTLPETITVGDLIYTAD